MKIIKKFSGTGIPFRSLSLLQLLPFLSGLPHLSIPASVSLFLYEGDLADLKIWIKTGHYSLNQAKEPEWRMERLERHWLTPVSDPGSVQQYAMSLLMVSPYVEHSPATSKARFPSLLTSSLTVYLRCKSSATTGHRSPTELTLLGI